MKRTLYPTQALAVLSAFLFFVCPILAQDTPPVLLRTGAVSFPDNIREYVSEATISVDETVGGSYFRLIQFQEMPNEARLAQLAAAGIELLEYIPHQTYLASIPTQFQTSRFLDLGVRSILPLGQDLKMSDALKSRSIPDWAMQKGEVLAIVKYHKNLRHEAILAYCQMDGLSVLRENGHNNYLRVSFPIEKIDEVAAMSYVAYVELVPAPDVKDDILGRSLHRANAIDTKFPGGRKYNGEGVGVLCRDDGFVGPHIDFAGRITNITEGDNGTHGDGVSGIMCGAGNLDPRNKGMADGAELYVLDYESDFLDETMDLHLNNGVLVTNSSYSNGCNAGYTEITETVDQQLFQNPTLLHVFSAGNSNGFDDCGYGAGTQWANITGGHKQAKNCVTTANLNDDATIRPSSSRGPASDGRIKPDIAAHGAGQISTDPDHGYQSFGGTSAASPGIAGITAQLHQAYRELNGGETADAALLKSILLNTANDLGNPGPDFTFGWGQVNAYRAVLALEENRYLAAAVSLQGENTHNITIPEGVLQARMMVYWADQEGSVMAAKALVNDLDTWVSDASGTNYLPWVLDTTSSPTNLAAPATHGEDHLNNLEQIAIANPEPGEYTLHVEGTELPFGEHPYYVVWELRMDEVMLTHPIGGESFLPGENVRIHWDGMDTGTAHVISYSTNGGALWTPIIQADPDAMMYDWEVPNEISGNVLVKVQKGPDGPDDQSDAAFSIAPMPTNVEVTQACPETIRLEWDAVDFGPANTEITYEVFLLGEKYMKSMGNTADLFFDVTVTDPAEDNWLAVRAKGDNGIVSERTNAILFNEGLLNCTQTIDLAIGNLSPANGSLVFLCGESEITVAMEIQNVGQTPLNNIEASYRLNGGTPVTELISGTIEPGASSYFEFSQSADISDQAQHTIEVAATVDGDNYPSNNMEVLEVSALSFPAGPVPTNFSEDFEGSIFPPANFNLINADENESWEQQFVMDALGGMTNCASVNNYSYNAQGEEDELMVVPVTLAGVTSPFLTFEVAYATYDNTLFDGLEVRIGTCGSSTTETVFEKFGMELATAGSVASSFSPDSPADWRTETIDLSEFIGEDIIISFVNINGWGNNLFVDNINVMANVPPTSNFTVSATEICQGESILFSNNSSGMDLDYLWDFGVSAQPSTSTSDGPVEVVFAESGTFESSLTASNSLGNSTSTETITVHPLPVPGFSFSTAGNTVSFINNSQFADSYIWNFGDNNGSSASDPMWTYTESGEYTVVLTATNGCGSVDFETLVNIGVNESGELARRLSAQISPNPTSGPFVLMVENDQAEMVGVEILDAKGVVLQKTVIVTALGQTDTAFDFSAFPAGFYFIKITGEDGFKALKLMVV